MAELKFADLKKTYEDFKEPKVVVTIGGKDVSAKESRLMVTEVDVELTSGYEAGMAVVTLGGAFDPDNRQFDIRKNKEYIYLGSLVTIAMGYAETVKTVFTGFVARVHFIVPGYDTDEAPGIELTVMDAKAAMMANRHSKRLKAMYYSDAVKEVLEANAFIRQKDDLGNSFNNLVINDTPDKKAGGNKENTNDTRVEMVEESDYEFIVKAAKKYNFEFFIVGSDLYFIEAKKNTNVLLELDPYDGMLEQDIGYDITGLVRKVEVRNVESEKGTYIGKSEKLNSKISLGNKATPLIEGQSLVYLDPSALTKEEAGYRAVYLKNMVDYRLGSLEATYVGIPELIPGRFIQIVNAGKPLNNKFYLTRVHHILQNGRFTTEIEGCANAIGS